EALDVAHAWWLRTEDPKVVQLSVQVDNFLVRWVIEGPDLREAEVVSGLFAPEIAALKNAAAPAE
ncbi:MAG: hypothetical protein AAF211_28630, partial [Myxococcota bacterium]